MNEIGHKINFSSEELKYERVKEGMKERMNVNNVKRDVKIHHKRNEVSSEFVLS